MTLLADLSNEELLAEVSRLAMRERQATAALIRGLMEVDALFGAGWSGSLTCCGLTRSGHLHDQAGPRAERHANADLASRCRVRTR
jgi:hypothetical protein